MSAEAARDIGLGGWIQGCGCPRPKRKGTTRMRTPSPVHRYTFIQVYTWGTLMKKQYPPPYPAPRAPTQSAFRHSKPNGSLKSDSGLQAGDWTRCSNKGSLNTCFFFQLKLQNTSSPPPSPQLCCQKASSTLTCIITLGSLSVSLHPLLSPVLFSKEQPE